MEIIDLEDDPNDLKRSEDRHGVVYVGSSDNDSVVEVELSSPMTKYAHRLARASEPLFTSDPSPISNHDILDIQNWLSSDTNVEDSFAHLLAKPSHGSPIVGSQNVLRNSSQNPCSESLDAGAMKASSIDEKYSITGKRDVSFNNVDADTTFDEHSKMYKQSTTNPISPINNDADDISINLPRLGFHTDGTHQRSDDSMSEVVTPQKRMPQIGTLPMPLFMDSSQEATQRRIASISQQPHSSVHILRSSPQVSNYVHLNPPSENALRDILKEGYAHAPKSLQSCANTRTLGDVSRNNLSVDELVNTDCIVPPIIQLSDPIEFSQSSPLKLPKKRPPASQSRALQGPPKRAKASLTSQGIAFPVLDIEYSAKDLKNANRVTRKRSELMSEMVLKIPQQVYDAFDEPHLKEVFEEAVVEPIGSYLPLISWHRNLTARYDAQLDVFIPSKAHVMIETHKVLYYKASEFCDKLMLARLKYDLSLAMAISKEEHDADYLLTIMIEGYDQFISKLRNTENTQYKTQVLDRLSSSRGTDTSPTKALKKPQDRLLNLVAKDVEHRLNQTQLECGINIFPVRTSTEAIDWLASQTYTIAWSLYDKFERNNSLANLALVRSGSDAKSTFLQSIRQFKFMTEAKADKLYCVHQSLQSVFNAFKANGLLGTDTNGKNIVPPSVETAMSKVFLSKDPGDFIQE